MSIQRHLRRGLGVTLAALILLSATTALADRYEERSASAVTDAALAWLGRRGSEAPFFAWLHYFDPHRPWNAPQAFADRFPDNGYDAEIAYVDSEIGRLLSGLEQTETRRIGPIAAFSVWL